jgi:hypothetical protein
LLDYADNFHAATPLRQHATAVISHAQHSTKRYFCTNRVKVF